jgi:predicted PurR-regulated permease PerM
MKLADDKESMPPPEGAKFGLTAAEVRVALMAAIVVAAFLYLVKLILLPFMMAGIVAYICTPALDWAARRTGWPRLVFALLAYAIILAGAALVLTLAFQRLTAEVIGTAEDLQAMMEHLANQAIGNRTLHIFGTAIDAHGLVDQMLDRIRDWLGETDQITTAAGGSIATIMGTFLMAVLLIYFLATGHSLARGLLWMVPPQHRPLVAAIWQRLDPLLMRYFLGVIVIVAYTTAAAYIGLGVILGIDHAVLLALLTGIVEIVPVMGPTAAAVIAGLVSLRTATGIINILEYAAYATALRLSVDQVVAPIVLGRAANVHPVLIIFCFMAGGIVLGVPGVILAVPVALAVRSTLETLYGDTP